MRCLSVSLYDDPSTPSLDLAEIAEFICECVPNCEVDKRPELLSFYLSSFGEHTKREVAKRIAQVRVTDIFRAIAPREPLLGEIEYERRLIEEPSRKASGVLYDGYELAALCAELIGRGDLNPDHIHIAFTSRLLATREDDGRYHARVIIVFNPSLISTSGVVEAPAKRREFYVMLDTLHNHPSHNAFLADIKKNYKGSFLEYDDERMTEVLKGYALQAIFYNLFGEAFCENKRCRLYNAHWQEELIEAQLRGHGLCERHKRVLDSLLAK